MNNFNLTDINFSDYKEVSAEEYSQYYEDDTLFIRWKAYTPNYFVRRNAPGKKDQIKEEIERRFGVIKKSIQALLDQEHIPAGKLRLEIEKIKSLRDSHKQLYLEEVDELFEALQPFYKTQ